MVRDGGAISPAPHHNYIPPDINVGNQVRKRTDSPILGTLPLLISNYSENQGSLTVHGEPDRADGDGGVERGEPRREGRKERASRVSEKKDTTEVLLSKTYFFI